MNATVSTKSSAARSTRKPRATASTVLPDEAIEGAIVKKVSRPRAKKADATALLADVMAEAGKSQEPVVQPTVTLELNDWSFKKTPGWMFSAATYIANTYKCELSTGLRPEGHRFAGYEFIQVTGESAKVANVVEDANKLVNDLVEKSEAHWMQKRDFFKLNGVSAQSAKLTFLADAAAKLYN